MSVPVWLVVPGVRLQIWVCWICAISTYSNGAVQIRVSLELAGKMAKMQDRGLPQICFCTFFWQKKKSHSVEALPLDLQNIADPQQYQNLLNGGCGISLPWVAET